MAGHPTVGTAFVLDRGDRIVFEEGVGPVPVERVRAAERRDALADDPAARALRPALRRSRRPRGRARSRRRGSRSRAALRERRDGPAVPDRPAALARRARARAACAATRGSRSSARVDGAQPYLFVPTGATTARCRMFGPGHGIAEDPATGAAAGPLGAYWLAHGLATPERDGVARLVFTQGVEYGRPSELFVEVEDAAIRVAGACVPSAAAGSSSERGEGDGPRVRPGLGDSSPSCPSARTGDGLEVRPLSPQRRSMIVPVPRPPPQHIAISA